MSEDMSKTEKERQLDEKIKAMRAKNAMAMERKKEVDKDKQLAEINRSSVTSVTKSKYESDSYFPPERLKTKQRTAYEDVQETIKEGSRRTGGRYGDTDGPPPDPGYRFLADRMREEEIEESFRKGRDAGRTTGTGTKASKPATVKSVKDRLSNTSSNRSEERVRERKQEEDDIVIILEKDRFGRIQNHSSPQSSKVEDRRTVMRKQTTGASIAISKDGKPTKIKSLFDDDDKYVPKEKWISEEPKGLVSPRKIEDLSGKITITRTVENLKPTREPEPYREKSIPPRFDKRSERSPSFSGDSTQEDFSVSEVAWQCSDPACNRTNLPGTFQCSHCKLAYVKSNEYKNSLACEKYKQEFTRKPKPNQYSNGVNPPIPQPLFQPEAQLREWKPEPVEMIAYGNEWNPGLSMNQWQMSQDLMMAQQYSMMVNTVPVASFQPPPPQPFYTPTQIHPAQQYYSQPEYISSPYPTGPHFSTYQAHNATNFNPSAQSFIPTSEPAPGPIFQTPPPTIHSGLRIPSHPVRPPPNSVKPLDPNLLISLKSPPKPLAFNRGQEPRRQFSDGTYRTYEESSLSSRLTDKNSQNSRFPPRFNKNKDYTSTVKPPSMVEMQSGSLKKGSAPLPPPANKGNGLLVFGTSNVMNHLDTLKMSKMFKLPVRLVAAMKLETFEEKVQEVNPSRDWLVLIHGLGNDARNIALRRNSDQEKAKEADEVANKFCDLIEDKILSVSSHICVLISMLLPRCDFQERSGMSNPNNVRKVINVQITSRLYENSRVTLINSDPVLVWDQDEEKKKNLLQSDGYHLTQVGFDLMIENWTIVLCKHLNLKVPTKSVTPPIDEEIQNPLLEEESTSTSTEEEVVESVPDPFETYTAPSAVLSPKTKLDGEDVDLESSNDDWDDDSIPNLETVPHKSDDVNTDQDPTAAPIPFYNGISHSENGDGFIEDDYCGDEVERLGPLPSLNLVSSGPESDFGPVSGLYMEDSYLPESIETLSISHISTQIKDLSADSLLSEPLQEELIKAKSLIDQVQIEQKTELA